MQALLLISLLPVNFVPLQQVGSPRPFSDKATKVCALSYTSVPMRKTFASQRCVVQYRPNYERLLGIHLKRVFTGHHQYGRRRSPTPLAVSGREAASGLCIVRSSALNLGPQNVYPLSLFSSGQALR